MFVSKESNSRCSKCRGLLSLLGGVFFVSFLELLLKYALFLNA